jgi:hypothetical protein
MLVDNASPPTARLDPVLHWVRQGGISAELS